MIYNFLRFFFLYHSISFRFSVFQFQLTIIFWFYIIIFTISRFHIFRFSNFRTLQFSFFQILFKSSNLQLLAIKYFKPPKKERKLLTIHPQKFLPVNQLSIEPAACNDSFQIKEISWILMAAASTRATLLAFLFCFLFTAKRSRVLKWFCFESRDSL